MMHAVGRELSGWQILYTPYYANRLLESLRPTGLLERTVLGGELRRQTEEYLADHRLPLDPAGQIGGDDPAVTRSALIVPQKKPRRALLLVHQRGNHPP